MTALLFGGCKAPPPSGPPTMNESASAAATAPSTSPSPAGPIRATSAGRCPWTASSPGEAQVVAALFEGLRPTAIAERHGVSTKTVRNQLSAAYARLEVTGRADLLATYRPN